jgi:hypothetical protein
MGQESAVKVIKFDIAIKCEVRRVRLDGRDDREPADSPASRIADILRGPARRDDEAADQDPERWDGMA